MILLVQMEVDVLLQIVVSVLSGLQEKIANYLSVHLLVETGQLVLGRINVHVLLVGSVLAVK